MTKMLLISAAVSGFLAVAIGAFGAHGLRERLSPEMMAVFQTGVQYHFYHTLALLAVAVLSQYAPLAPGLALSGLCFLLGIVVFWSTGTQCHNLSHSGRNLSHGNENHGTWNLCGKWKGWSSIGGVNWNCVLQVW